MRHSVDGVKAGESCLLLPATRGLFAGGGAEADCNCKPWHRHAGDLPPSGGNEEAGSTKVREAAVPAIEGPGLPPQPQRAQPLGLLAGEVPQPPQGSVHTTVGSPAAGGPCTLGISGGLPQVPSLHRAYSIWNHIPNRLPGRGGPAAPSSPAP